MGEAALPKSSHKTRPWPVFSLGQAHALLTAPGLRFEMDEALIDGLPTRLEPLPRGDGFAFWR